MTTYPAHVAKRQQDWFVVKETKSTPPIVVPSVNSTDIVLAGPVPRREADKICWRHTRKTQSILRTYLMHIVLVILLTAVVLAEVVI